MKKPFFYSRKEINWILYDVANSAFVLIMVTTMMPIFYKEFAAASMAAEQSTATWGYANSISAFILAFLSPVLGAFADYPKQKKKFFVTFLSVGIASSLLLVFSQSGAWIYVLTMYILATLGWAGANLFYNSLLVDVTNKKRFDTISSAGFGWGYIGSVIPFLGFVALTLFFPSGKNHSLNIQAVKITIVITTLWWGLFSLPIIFKVRQRFSLPTSRTPVKDSFTRLLNIFSEIQTNKKLMYFLIAYFFYIDGINTIISMSVAYGQDIHVSTTILIAVILVIQVLGFPFSLLFGSLARRVGARAMIFAGIGVYALITLISYFLADIENQNTRELMFWFLAFLISTSQGGVQALSRSVFAANIPKEKASEYFGFYSIFGKFAAILGPALMGITGSLLGHSRYGVLSLSVLFLLGIVFLLKAGKFEAEI